MKDSLYVMAGILSGCLVIFLLVGLASKATAPPVPVQKAGQYKAVLTVLVKGSDGTLAAEREITIPFVPYVRIQIDLFEVEGVMWSTRREAFILQCRSLTFDEMKAREALKTLSGGEWKENFFHKKK